MFLCLFCLLVVLLLVFVFVFDIVDGGVCCNGVFFFEQSGFVLVCVVDVLCLYLFGDMDGCFVKGELVCCQCSYVVNGDMVVIGCDLGCYCCVFFLNKVGGSVGWVDCSRL